MREERPVRTVIRAAVTLAAVAGLALPWTGLAAQASTADAADGRGAAIARVQAVLQVALDSLAARPGIPGLSLGVVLPDGSSTGLVAGMADTARGTPLPPTARMLQGSVGKTYFGAVALQLVAEGRVTLDEPVGPVLGDPLWLHRIPNGPRVTLRHLLGHTSGIVRYELSPGFLADLRADPMRSWTPEGRLGYLLDAEAPFAPGEAWEYSDTNYILVAMVIEAVTGGSAYDAIRRRFLGPLGLDATVPSDGPAVPGLVQGYAGPDHPFGDFDAVLRADGRMVYNPQFEWGGGGFASTAEELARWTHHVQNGGAFPPELMDDFLAVRPAPLGPGGGYGLGVIALTLPAGPARGHSGIMPGYRTEAYHFPDPGFTLALQVNSSDGAALQPSPLRMLSDLAEGLAGALGDRGGEEEAPSSRERATGSAQGPGGEDDR